MKMMKKIFLIYLFVIFLLFNCKRVEKEVWKIPQIKIDLGNNLTIIKQVSAPQTLLFSLGIEDFFEINFQISYQVKQRGKGIPSLVSEVKENLKAGINVLSVENNLYHLQFKILDLEVETTPQINGDVDEIKNYLRGKVFIMVIDPQGEIIEFKPQEDGRNQNVLSLINKILQFSFPSFPLKSVIAGEKWQFNKVLKSVLPGNGELITKINGKNTYSGKVIENDGGTVFLIEEESELSTDGASNYKGMKFECKGNGIEKGAFYFDPQIKIIKSGEVRVFEHKNFSVFTKHRKSMIEQFEALHIKFNIKD